MKTLKYILLGLTTVGVSSCDDFLVETPQTDIAKDGVYNSVSSAKSALAGCYAKMSDYNAFGYNYVHVLNVTSGMGVSIKQNDVNLTSMNILPSDVNLTSVYNGTYEVIRVANDIIDGMQHSTISNEAEKNRIWGEAYFSRAVSYFNLVRLFGKVSLITAPVKNYADAQQPRAAVELVYAQIESDLEKAWELMAEAGKGEPGHPHKYAAKAVLAKVYLTMATELNEDTYLQKAFDAGKEVYDAKVYQLVRPYAALFGSENKNNAESIFEIQFSATVNSGRTTEMTFPVGHPLMSNIMTQGKSWGKTRPTPRAFDQFDEADPRREVSFVSTNYSNIFEANEKKKTILLYPTAKADGTKQKWTYKQGDSEYAAWKKYYDKGMTAQASNCNFVYYRYADLLMVLAEAANELGLPEASVYLNEVLDRARDRDGNSVIEPTELYPLAVTAEEAADKALLRERIFRERLKELTGECDEWYTIRRMGTSYLKKIMEEHNTRLVEWYEGQSIDPASVKFVYTYEVTDHNVKKNMLMPFPADEIVRNQNISQEDQNFGY